MILNTSCNDITFTIHLFIGVNHNATKNTPRRFCTSTGKVSLNKNNKLCHQKNKPSYIKSKINSFIKKEKIATNGTDFIVYFVSLKKAGT